MKEIRAAGTVTVDTSGSKPKILMVHRPGYDDWTIPKGKIRFNEFEAVAAHRKTREETGATVRLDIGEHDQLLGGWWQEDRALLARGAALGEEAQAQQEVDQVVWLTPKNALKRLTYDDEKELVDQALSCPYDDGRPGARTARRWSGRIGADATSPVRSARRGASRLIDLVPLLPPTGSSRWRPRPPRAACRPSPVGESVARSRAGRR